MSSNIGAPALQVKVVLAATYDDYFDIAIVRNGTVFLREGDTTLEGGLELLTQLQDVLGCSYAVVGEVGPNGGTAIHPIPPPGMPERTPLVSVSYLRLNYCTSPGSAVPRYVYHHYYKPVVPDGFNEVLTMVPSDIQLGSKVSTVGTYMVENHNRRAHESFQGTSQMSRVNRGPNYVRPRVHMKDYRPTGGNCFKYHSVGIT